MSERTWPETAAQWAREREAREERATREAAAHYGGAWRTPEEERIIVRSDEIVEYGELRSGAPSAFVYVEYADRTPLPSGPSETPGASEGVTAHTLLDPQRDIRRVDVRRVLVIKKAWIETRYEYDASTCRILSYGYYRYYKIPAWQRDSEG